MGQRSVYTCDRCQKVIPEGVAVCQVQAQLWGDSREAFVGECGPTPFLTRHFCPACRGPALAAAGVTLHVEKPADKPVEKGAKS